MVFQRYQFSGEVTYCKPIKNLQFYEELVVLPKRSARGCTKTNITKYMYRNMYLPHHSMYFRRRRCLYGMAELPETAE